MNRKNHTPFIKRTLLLFQCALQAVFAVAQDRLPELIRFPTLDFNAVYRIGQDRHDLLWLATNRGLFCFDGRLFRKIVHAPNGVSAIDNGQINDLLLEEDEEKLWIATTAGASTLDLKTGAFTDYIFYRKGKPHLTDGECESVFKDRAGTLWFGVSGVGLARLIPGVDSIPRLFPVYSDNKDRNAIQTFHIYQIRQDAGEDAILWLATYSGLVRFNARTERYDIPDQKKIADDIVGPSGRLLFTSLYPTREKIFLGSMWGNYGVVYDLKTGAFRALDVEQPFRLALTQYRSPATFWNFHGPINIIDIEAERIIRSFYKPYEEEKISNAFMENPDQFWLSSNKGLFLYDFSYYQVENHLLTDYGEGKGKPSMLRVALEREAGRVFWLVFQHSDFLYEYDRERGILRKVPWPEDDPLHPIPWRDGRMLFLGQSGFYELRDDQFRHLPLLEELFAKDSGAFTGPVVPDGEGGLWLARRWEGSLYKIDLEKERYCDYGASAGVSGVAPMFRDAAGNIWMGGDGQGFVVYHARKDTFFTFPFQPGEQRTIRYPRGFAQDDHGDVWVSDTRVGGLMKVDPSCLEEGIQSRFIAHNGPQSNRMWQPTVDRKGRIWTITLDGLQAFDPQKETFTLYGASAGFRLQTSDQSPENFLPAYLTLLSTGEMLVGYKEGFAIFHPDSLQGNRELPRPYLLALTGGGRPLINSAAFAVPEEIVLTHDQNRLAFEFSAVAWRESDKVRFSYRLKGAEGQWVETKQPSATYSNLSPGAYAFQLHALNSDGKKAGKPLEVRFKILPPWWGTWWAYALYAGLILAVASFLYTYKERQWRLETQLFVERQEAERLKELNALKTRLYTNITHEFRTPLTIVLGMADQIRSDPENWYREGLKMIKRNGSHLLHLVNQMLDLSKVEAGTMSVNWVYGDLIPYLRYLFESFQSQARSKGIDLTFSTGLEAARMDYDPDKMLQIVSNLIGNAIKFTPEGGAVSMEVGCPDGAEPEFLELRITDNGIGIPEDKLPFIFDRFYQVADDSTRNAGGTGIGLALTKELVKLLGGNITVQSTAGAGSAFRVSLPVHRTAEPVENMDLLFAKEGSLPFAAFPSGDLRSGTGDKEQREKPLLLIIEDNPDVVRYLKACLQNDYQLEAARDGSHGVRKALELIPDVIISDVMMPEKDGFEVCETLKRDMRTSHIPIILLTAKADADSRIEGLKRGADAFLTKPFNREELSVRLQKTVELRERLREKYRAGPSPESTPFPDLSLEDTFMQSVREKIEEHFSDENFRAAGIYRDLGMSRPQFYRKFKALTGQQPGIYLRTFRLHKARKLLLRSPLSISEVAYRVGFRDPGYFSRVFKEEFGTSPREVSPEKNSW